MKLKSIVVAAVLAGLAVPSISLASAAPEGPHISTSASGAVKVAPDMATLSINVQVTNKDAAAAKAAVDKRVAEYYEFLKKNGIEKQDIDAANVRTQPNYDYSSASKPTLKGYTAIRTVDVKVKKLDQLNVLLDGALTAGLNEINSVQFGVSDPQKYRNAARDQAMKNAQLQAEALAKGFNAQLGPIYSINYNAPADVPYPMAVRGQAGSLKAAAQDLNVNETYEQQSIDFNDQVDVVFEIKR
ncbi:MULTISPECIES: oxidative stress defense protein [Providencia]|uniref:Oxidative stress defense protein n=2 Tax=Providencia alcalifaciens TaxID=126385 RepID=A0AAW9V7T9_9GAMM|nr:MULTISPECIES: oxidative stress defense protein [Providencia]ETT07156.1 PF04402 family protein [Providencia alcalifaciens F90-2004]EUD02980.1 PF04402 family protein [Providencia alcalifaciens RIMD 1656011]EUD09100.1 PF04402 family protein [Providencia alcalifaciens 205/92]MTC16219.1 oxidative stress defense protein [Providencia alcalifaciens]MTC30222.1 oxidative stress defense protein [Providencia alcalifaciens]